MRERESIYLHADVRIKDRPGIVHPRDLVQIYRGDDISKQSLAATASKPRAGPMFDEQVVKTRFSKCAISKASSDTGTVELGDSRIVEVFMTRVGRVIFFIFDPKISHPNHGNNPHSVMKSAIIGSPRAFQA